MNKERLEEIRDFNKEATARIGMSTPTSAVHCKELLSIIDTLQADLERLSKERDELLFLITEANKSAQGNIDATIELICQRDTLKSQVTQLRGALEFYAKEENYSSCYRSDLEKYVPADSEGTSEIEYWNVKIARDALASGEKENG